MVSFKGLDYRSAKPHRFSFGRHRCCVRRLARNEPQKDDHVQGRKRQSHSMTFLSWNWKESGTTTDKGRLLKCHRCQQVVASRIVILVVGPYLTVFLTHCVQIVKRPVAWFLTVWPWPNLSIGPLRAHTSVGGLGPGKPHLLGPGAGRSGAAGGLFGWPRP